jgi:hypothetical protein
MGTAGREILKGNLVTDRQKFGLQALPLAGAKVVLSLMRIYISSCHNGE